MLVGCETGKIKLVSWELGRLSDVEGTELNAKEGIRGIYVGKHDDPTFYADTVSGSLKTVTFAGNNNVISKAIGSVDQPIAGLAQLTPTKLCVCDKDSGGDFRIYDTSMPANFQFDRSISAISTGPVNCLGVSWMNAGVVFTGGKCNNLKIWDLNKEECLFRARNPPHDKYSLAVQVTVSQLLILDERNRAITGTSKHGLHLFDPALPDNRAVSILKFSDHCVSSMTLSTNPWNIIVGDTAGSVGSLDIRKASGVVCKYKGPSSAIKGICAQSRNVIIASLDGFIRGYDFNTRELLWKVFAKSRISAGLPIDRACEYTQQQIDELISSIISTSQFRKTMKRKTACDNHRLTSSKRRFPYKT